MNCPIGYGTANGYSYYGCRCDDCADAKRRSDRLVIDRRTGVEPATMHGQGLPIGPLLVELDGVSRETIEAEYGIPFNTLSKWRSRGMIPALSADRVACALGLHPGSIWPEWWDVS